MQVVARVVGKTVLKLTLVFVRISQGKYAPLAR